jgi:hypothetical protein
MKKGLLRAGLSFTLILLLDGCGNGVATPGQSTDAALNQSAPSVSTAQGCLNQLPEDICPMIAFTTPVVCAATSLLNGQPIPELSVSAANGCISQALVEQAGCNAGLTFAQVEQLDIQCTGGPTGVLAIPH